MSAHLHAEIIPGCYRCEIGRDEVAPATAPSPAESPGELRAAIRQLIHDDSEMGYSESTSDELADVILALPALARLLETQAAVRRVEELIDPATEMAYVVFGDRVFDEASIRRALDGEDE